MKNEIYTPSKCTKYYYLLTLPLYINQFQIINQLKILKMKTLLKFLPVAIMLMVSNIVIAQDSILVEKMETTKENQRIKVRPIRIGAKIGFPNLVGGNLEYVTPILKNKIAANVDYSSRKSSWFPTGEGESLPDLKFSYLGGGVNYYIFKPGKGLYTGLSYGNLKFEGSEQEITSDTDENKTGTGFYDFSHNAVNLKLGLKWGGLFYSRIEGGYSLSKFPKSIDRKVVFNDGSTEMQKLEFDSEDSPVPQSALFSGLIFNIGFGFSF